MDAQQKKKIIGQTNDACNSMIMGIRQLRLSVLELFNTLADTGVDPEKSQQQPQPANQHHHSHHHHHHHHHHQSDTSPTSNGKLYHQQTIASLTNSHTLCTASNPPPRIQKQLELQQQQDLIQFVDQSISSIASTIRNLEQDIAVLMQNHSFINTGETVHIATESSLDKHNLYVELCSSYKTISRLNDYSANCHALLLQQSLKRKNKRSDAASMSYASSASSQNSQLGSQQQASLVAARSDSIVATFNPYIHKIPSASKQSINSLLDAYLKLHEHMDGTYSQPFGVSSGVLQVSVSRVLKAILVMRGIVIDAVIVKAYHESFANKSASGATDLTSGGLIAGTVGGSSPFVDTDKHDIDLWSESKYNVFRRLTHHANAAVLHFQYPLYPEIAVRSFLSWFNSYSDLFSAICSRCNQRLRKFMPPICRDFSAGFHPHHDSCK